MTSPLRTIRLVGTDVETTRLGFGCGGLFFVPNQSDRRRLVDGVLDSGIRHLDVAPMYGLGRVEREIGLALRGRHDDVVLATKFGIEPTRAGRLVSHVQSPLQRALRAAPALRAQARPQAGDPRAGSIGRLLYDAPGYDARTARASLERSLRELGRDHVDILFLHDPVPGAVRSDDVRGYLESARADGRLRAWGIAGEPDAVVHAARALGGEVPVLQLRDDVFLRSRHQLGLRSAQATIVFGALARALPRILDHVRDDDDLRRRWSDALGADASRSDVVASLLLRDALREHEGPVLFSTTRPEHVVAAVEAASADEGELAAFRVLVTEVDS
jgi:D-threo-aldose 1-dehydrogenase